jgi:hypothetical protein
MMKILKCPHCETDNVVAECSRCGRHFVLTGKRLAGARREFNDFPVNVLPVNDIQPCDFCQSKDDKERFDKQVAKGLSQKTCPSCHIELLSSHGFDK